MSFLRKQLPRARRVLDAENDTFLRLRWTLANTLIMDALNGGASSNVAEARKIFENLIPTVRRVYGIAHPFTKGVEDEYEQLASRLGEFG